MARLYILVYSDVIGDRESVKKILCSMSEIIRWRYDMPNSFYIISSNSAQELSAAFSMKIRLPKRFLFAEITNNRQGYLVKETWDFMNNAIL